MHIYKLASQELCSFLLFRDGDIARTLLGPLALYIIHVAILPHSPFQLFLCLFVEQIQFRHDIDMRNLQVDHC